MLAGWQRTCTSFRSTDSSVHRLTGIGNTDTGDCGGVDGQLATRAQGPCTEKPLSGWRARVRFTLR